MRLAMHRTIAVIVLAVLVAACQGAGQATRSGSAEPFASSAPAIPAPAGTIAFNRVRSGQVEDYFTIKTDGTAEHALFSIQGCSCLHWAPDGSEIWALSETDHGTVAFTTMDADGSDRTVHEPTIKTLSLAPGAWSSDGRVLAFNGWDDSEPANTGLYLGSPDLSDLRLVTALPDGTRAVEPFGVTPDGSQVLFFGERGPTGDVTHSGDLFVIDADGTNLRQINADNLTLGMVRGVPASLSPDGKRVTFAAFDGDPSRSAVYVAALRGGKPEPIIESIDGIWSADWAPVGERITYATLSSTWVVNGDGTNLRDVSGGFQTGFGAWAPDGKHLVLSRGEEEPTRDLWIVDSEGTFLGQVTHQPGKYDVYIWSP